MFIRGCDNIALVAREQVRNVTPAETSSSRAQDEDVFLTSDISGASMKERELELLCSGTMCLGHGVNDDRAVR